MDKNLKAISAFEQAGAHLGNFATLLQTYHKSLCNAGFQRDEALELVREFQKTLFSQAFNLGTPEDED